MAAGDQLLVSCGVLKRAKGGTHVNITLFGDVKRMKTREILLADEKHVTAQIKTMKIKELERHTKKLLALLGQTDYDQVMAAAIKAIPQLDSAGNRFQILQELIEAQLPSESTSQQQPVLERVTVLIMVLVAKKFTKILKEQD
ncbi:hypothetical protein [Marinagarivorans cellulosilyticus]|uniref:Uncharacterized protein n=1 Tax=Marinagarivorans cellulosilyticus TaxID=2721545 RepID=A0AAN2BJS4_9GAMM|nr:hypothetical protein [Marinagarivorans cellulosilyticus]BCD97262.1 hypothetical protein MARGE09_P1463 [Marinagarivorans cellulosilyticus]